MLPAEVLSVKPEFTVNPDEDEDDDDQTLTFLGVRPRMLRPAFSASRSSQYSISDNGLNKRFRADIKKFVIIGVFLSGFFKKKSSLKM